MKTEAKTFEKEEKKISITKWFISIVIRPLFAIAIWLHDLKWILPAPIPKGEENIARFPWQLSEPNSRWAIFQGIRLHFELVLPNGFNSWKRLIILRDKSKEDNLVREENERDFPPHFVVEKKVNIDTNKKSCTQKNEKKWSFFPNLDRIQKRPSIMLYLILFIQHFYEYLGNCLKCIINKLNLKKSFYHNYKKNDSFSDSEKLKSLNTQNDISSFHTKNSFSPTLSGAILFHGFLSSSFTWRKIAKPLANFLNIPFLGFDRPGFGYSERVKVLNSPIFLPKTTKMESILSSNIDSSLLQQNPYTSTFSANVGNAFSAHLNTNESRKVILIGHSAGGVVAIDTYFENPKYVAGIILVSPCIAISLAENLSLPKDKWVKENWIQYKWVQYGCSLFGLKFVQKVVKGLKEMLCDCFWKSLIFSMKSRFGGRIVKFVFCGVGVQMLRFGWHDTNSLSCKEAISGTYRGMRCRGWEEGLASFAATCFAAMVGGRERRRSLVFAGNKLDEIHCPVLVISGDNDWLIPLWNSRRVASAIPGAQIAVIKDCGHVPQEEKPQEFIDIVTTFVNKI